MRRLIIVGSPRVNGRSAHLAEMLFETNIAEHPEDELFLVPVSEVEIGPCIACDGCREMSNVIMKDENGAEVTVQRHRCVFDDDMQALYDIMDDVDEVTVVSPVFFSGAPAPMKCVLDRLQPYYWANARAAEKRPATLHVIGEGSDPHGYSALVSEMKSALAVAGFRLERVLDWVGKIDAEGEITAEAEERLLGDVAVAETRLFDEGSAEATAGASSKPRPKLNLHAGLNDEPQSEGKQGNSGKAAGQGKAGKSGHSSKNAELGVSGSSAGAAVKQSAPAKRARGGSSGKNVETSKHGIGGPNTQKASTSKSSRSGGKQQSGASKRSGGAASRQAGAQKRSGGKNGGQGSASKRSASKGKGKRRG